MTVRSVDLSSPAKLNLFLEVTGRRSDGYHRLSTIFQEIQLTDRLRAEIAPPGRVVCRTVGAALPSDSSNLVVRAAEAFLQTGRPKGVRFRLEKRLPIGAGLGGGSGNAATALKACWMLSTGRPLSEFPAHRYLAMAASLGADVPFFLRGGLARGEGIGDRLRPLRQKPPMNFVVVFPRVFTSTKEIFQSLRFPLTKRRTCLRLQKSLSDGAAPKIWAPMLFNRLEEISLRKWPVIAETRRALEQAGVICARMTGSGSAVFGVTENLAHARAVLKRLPKAGWDAWVTQSAP